MLYDFTCLVLQGVVGIHSTVAICIFWRLRLSSCFLNLSDWFQHLILGWYVPRRLKLGIRELESVLHIINAFIRATTVRCTSNTQYRLPDLA